MFELRWLHTRKGTPMVRRFARKGAALAFVLFVRTARPGTAFTLDGAAV